MSSTLLLETFGVLLSHTCTKVLKEGSAFKEMIIKEVLDSEQLEQKHFFDYQFSTLNENEQVSIDQWFHWFPGRWNSGFVTKRGRKSSGYYNFPPSVERMKAMEIAIIGFVRDCVSIKHIPSKWSVMTTLIIDQTKSQTVKPNINDIFDSLSGSESDLSIHDENETSSEFDETEQRKSKRTKYLEPLPKKSKQKSPPKPEKLDIDDFCESTKHNFEFLTADVRINLLSAMIDDFIIDSESFKIFTDKKNEEFVDIKRDLRECTKERKLA